MRGVGRSLGDCSQGRDSATAGREETPVQRGIVTGLAARPVLLAALDPGDLRPQPDEFDFGVLLCPFRFESPTFRLQPAVL